MLGHRLIIVLALAMGAVATAQPGPQSYVELRAAASSPGGVYRFAEFTHTFRNRAVVDFVYLGAPGQNEFYAGAGYQFALTPTLSFTPLAYVVAGKENGQWGGAIGAFMAGSWARQWNIYFFGGYFEPARGSVPRYFFVDSLDVSRSLKSKRWEFGGSVGMFHSRGSTSAMGGPMLVRNDRRGAWRLYVRGGSQVEGRLTRTFVF